MVGTVVDTYRIEAVLGAVGMTRRSSVQAETGLQFFAPASADFEPPAVLEVDRVVPTRTDKQRLDTV